MTLKEKADIEMMFGKARVTLTLDRINTDEIVNFFSRLKAGVEYDFIAKERARRSLNANSYHWVLVTKIAEACGISNAEAHNHLLADYGEDWLNEDGEPTYILMKDDDRYLKQETVHYRPTEHTEDRKGVRYRWFVLLLPSHLMDKRQMARLIDGTVSEAEAVGIDTRTPAEIEKLIQEWEVRL